MAAAEKKRFKFELLEGVAPHFEPNPDFNAEEPESEDNLREIEYEAGDTVTTTRPLDRLFVNKFRALGAASPGRTAGGDAPHPKHDPNKDRPVRSEEDARVARGDRFLEEDELDDPKLKKLAKGKSKVSEGDEEEEEEEEETEESSEDVTDQFEGAEDTKLQIFKGEDGRYRVHQAGEDEPMKGAKAGFKTKKRTLQFVKKQAQAQSEEE